MPKSAPSPTLVIIPKEIKENINFLEISAVPNLSAKNTKFK